MEVRLREVIAQVAEENGAWLVEATKGRSSRVLREEFPWLSKRPSLWPNSYFVATVGSAPLSVINGYVEAQKDR